MPVVRPFTATRRGSSVTLARGLPCKPIRKPPAGVSYGGRPTGASAYFPALPSQEKTLGRCPKPWQGPNAPAPRLELRSTPRKLGDFAVSECRLRCKQTSAVRSLFAPPPLGARVCKANSATSRKRMSASRWRKSVHRASQRPSRSTVSTSRKLGSSACTCWVILRRISTSLSFSEKGAATSKSMLEWVTPHTTRKSWIAAWG